MALLQRRQDDLSGPRGAARPEPVGGEAARQGQDPVYSTAAGVERQRTGGGRRIPVRVENRGCGGHLYDHPTRPRHVDLPYEIPARDTVRSGFRNGPAGGVVHGPQEREAVLGHAGTGPLGDAAGGRRRRCAGDLQLEVSGTGLVACPTYYTAIARWPSQE